MKKLLATSFSVVSAAAAVALTASASQAASLTSVTSLGNACLTSKCVSFQQAGYTVSGGNEINPSSSLTNEYLTPGSDTGNAGAVKSYNTAAVSYTSPLVPGGMTVSGLSGLLSFYWGSIDSYNQITFQGGEDVVYTGSNLATALGLTLGDYGNYNTDRYVSFVGDFTSAVFTTIYNAGNGNPKAFEVAVADVPEASGISTLLVVGAVAGGFALKNRLQQA